MKNITILFLFALLLSTSCRNFNTQNTQIVIKHDSVYGNMIADTIVYDVIIKNPNPEDRY